MDKGKLGYVENYLCTLEAGFTYFFYFPQYNFQCPQNYYIKLRKVQEYLIINFIKFGL